MRKENVKAAIKDLLDAYLEGLKYDPSLKPGEFLEALVEYTIETCDAAGIRMGEFDDIVQLTRMAQVAGERAEVDPKAAPS